MSKAIAYGIKLRLYMHEKNWQQAKAVAKTLMGMGYSLLANYEDVFKSAVNDELIWAVPSNTASDNYYVTEVLPNDFKRGYTSKGTSYIRGTEDNYFSGWKVYCMRWEFYDTFEDNDTRKQVILCEYDNSSNQHITRESGMVGAIPVKYMDTQFANWGTQTAQPVLRYAEVLLSFAEAENELATASKEAFRDYLLLERGHELFGEGVRRQDLIRHGVYIKLARERGNNAQDYQVLFPIPQFAITESNGILEQNPGY